MLTSTQKNEIIELIEEEKIRMTSYRAVAKKCKVSEASISQLRKGNYLGSNDEILERIGISLAYVFDNGSWKIANTTNFQIVTNVLTDAKSESMFVGIAHRAGSGKTVSSDVFHNANRRNNVFKLTAREWNGRYFLVQVAQLIGADIPKGYANINQLLDVISNTVKGMANTNPLLIVDQANSLKPSALRTFIHLFNLNEDILGLVILGTDNLETEIKRGVRLNKTGYDEFDSRFGRRYIHLIGNTLSDTRKICEANGIADNVIQKRIFDEAEPIRTTVKVRNQDKTIMVVEDTRRIKRLIKGERLKQKYNGNN